MGIKIIKIKIKKITYQTNITNYLYQQYIIGLNELFLDFQVKDKLYLFDIKAHFLKYGMGNITNIKEFKTI